MWPFKSPSETPPKAMPPLCTNCIFSDGTTYSRCANPKSPNGKTSPVDGSFTFPHCQIERENYSHIRTCGIAGKWFQPKRPEPTEEAKP